MPLYHSVVAEGRRIERPALTPPTGSNRVPDHSGVPSNAGFTYEPATTIGPLGGSRTPITYGSKPQPCANSVLGDGTPRRTRTYNCAGFEAAAYANSASGVWWRELELRQRGLDNRFTVGPRPTTRLPLQI